MSNETDSVGFAGHRFTAPELLALLDAAADGIFAQDSSGRLIYANPAAARFGGYDSPEEMVRGSPARVVDRYDLLDESGRLLPIEELPGRRALAGVFEAERVVCFHDKVTGEDRWTMVRARPILDESGSVRFAVTISSDVTEQMLQQKSLEENAAELEEIGAELEATVEELQARTQEAEAAQKRAEYVADRQRFLAEAGRMLAASLDPEATLRTITELAVPRMADWATVTLIDESGKPRQLAVAHADPAKLKFALDLQEKYPSDDEATLRIVRSGKSELYPEIPPELLEQSARSPEHLELIRQLQLNSAMVVPLKIRDQVLGTISFIGAESGRRFDKDDLEFAESLAARSALALSNAKLFMEAQEANRVKSDFLAVMSHELRTPLTAIFGYTELLSAGITGPVNPGQKGQLDRIRDSAAHLLGIIEDILNYARSEAGRDQVRLEKVRMSEVVNESLALVSNAANHKQLKLEQVVDRDCILNTDRVKFRQILVNLLGNAVKFTEKGTVRITARCEGVAAVVEVTDTGPGIAEGDLKRVFEPFRQLEGATTRTAGGTGLGLAVTRRFAELLGGTIDVRSRPGEGTTFILIVPLEPQVP
jgi:PAS domain S-box-containing protein